MKPNLITMLTYNDTTVGNAKDLYQQCSDLPVLHWGFKDVGLPRAKMVELVEAMQRDGKVTYLEVVSLSEKECMAGAEIAVACDFDCLMGTVFFDSVGEFLREHETDYFPFCGKVQGHPSVLSGSVDEIVDDAKRLQAHGVQGIDVLSYRHQSSAEELSRRLVAELDIPVVIAGSIASFERIELMKEIGPFGFTIGSALFERSFAKSESFRDELIAVVNHLDAE